MKLFLVVCCLTLAACAAPAENRLAATVTSSSSLPGTVGEDTTTSFEATVTTLPPQKQPIPVPTTAPVGKGGEAPSTTVALAIADLAGRIGASNEDVLVISSENVTWPNGALGCPKPGSSYTQALVPGYRIALRFDGRTYWYHGAEGGEPFLCELPVIGGSNS